MILANNLTKSQGKILVSFLKENEIKDTPLNRFKIRMGRHDRKKDGRVLKFNKTFSAYIKDVESITGTPMSREQKRLIKAAITEGRFVKLNKEEHADHRRKFNKIKKELILEWEKNTGMKWKTYDSEVYSSKGKVVRFKGQNYDAHEIILNSWGSPLKWWNIVPARFPDEHQNGIHRKNGLADKIFS